MRLRPPGLQPMDMHVFRSFQQTGPISKGMHNIVWKTYTNTGCPFLGLEAQAEPGATVRH